ncbi:MAG: Uma2 family endonuclease [Planctomycetota bacterium]|jgi:Uma2 family endonuclease|nr:Uma2 family endonuclease [Planctomycetota bacterium]MDP7132442.1 Uma2 family endonuclease [Planctomycetota bacterium]MDP7253689.1 Uma2 family endonuclease [Planctomycetota bacterium]
MSAQPIPKITPEEYLVAERKAETKSEYYRGEMFAMAGVSRSHNRITINVSTSLNIQFQGRTCEVFSSDMRVKVDPSGLHTYPDISALCGEPVFEDEELDTLLNPSVLIEVLSKSTEGYDRGGKV